MIVKQEKFRFSLDYFRNLLVRYACSSLDWMNLAHRLWVEYEDIVYVLSPFIYEWTKAEDNKYWTVEEQDLVFEKILDKYSVKLQKYYFI